MRCPNSSHCEFELPDSDCPLPTRSIESFLRYVRNDTDVIAVKIANQLLDSGKNIEQILNPDHGLRISVVVSCDGSYGLHVRCIVGSGRDVVGDGGNWQVDFDPDGNVIRALSESHVSYD